MSTVVHSKSAGTDPDNAEMAVLESPVRPGAPGSEAPRASAADPSSGTADAARRQDGTGGGAGQAPGTVTDDNDDSHSGGGSRSDGGTYPGPDGELPEESARPTDVTETLAADALMPEITFAPETFSTDRLGPESRQQGTAWDAAEVVTEIYLGHYNQLVRLAVLLVHDVQTAEEVVQDSFEEMHRAWRRLRDSGKALQYLRQTVVNKSRSVLRHRKVVDMHAPKPAPDEPSAEQAALVIIERSAVAAALRSLPERQREAIALRYYADFSEADIAKAMGISRGAVKSHTARAMAALRTILAQEP